MKATWDGRMGWPSAGQVLAAASAVPALALSGWLLAGVALLLLGWFGPVQMILLGVALTCLLCRYGLRRMPATVEATARQTAGLLGVALAFGVFNGVLHTEQLIVRRDPATYAQYATWLAVDGRLPITTDPAAFGGADPALRFDSVGFYRADAHLTPDAADDGTAAEGGAPDGVAAKGGVAEGGVSGGAVADGAAPGGGVAEAGMPGGRVGTSDVPGGVADGGVPGSAVAEGGVPGGGAGEGGVPGGGVAEAGMPGGRVGTSDVPGGVADGGVPGSAVAEGEGGVPGGGVADGGASGGGVAEAGVPGGGAGGGATEGAPDGAAPGATSDVLPQFMPGTPIILAFGHWMGGVPGLLLMPAILGALAVLTFGGTVARLVGARWSVLAAAALAVSTPILYTSRSPFSETCSMILLFGAINLLLDARHRLRASLLGVGFLPAAPAPLPEPAAAPRPLVRRWLSRRGGGAPAAPSDRRPGDADAAPPSPPAGDLGPGGTGRAATDGTGTARAGTEAGRAGLVRALALTRAIQAGDAKLVAALAGLVFGLALLVRIDALRDVLPVLAYAGMLIALHRYRIRRRASAGRAGGRAVDTVASDGRLGLPLLAGLAAGGGVGLVAGYLLAGPYLADLADSLGPLLAICAGVAAVTALGVALAPRLGAVAAGVVRRPSGRVARLLPGLAAGLVVAVVLGFAVRPWVQTVRRSPRTAEDMLTADFIAKTQLANGLPEDGTRLYYEDSLYWVIWYVGVPVVVFATFAAAVLVRRLARGREFVWLLPLAIIGWTTVTTLWRPAITPDHPFASRRLVPIIIPGLILLAAWALRWARARARRAGHDRRRQNALLAAGALLLLVPGAVTSIGTAFTPVERGEAAAVAGLCRAIPRDGSVLIVERVTGDRFTQLVRGMCGVPTARVAVTPGTDVAPPADVTRLTDRVRAAGRVPVLLAAEQSQLTPYGTPALALSLRTRQDERSLVSPPDGTWTLAIDVWLAVPGR